MDLNQLMRRVGRSSGVGRAFGPVYEHDGTTVIPVAISGGGGGGGGGWTPPDDADDTTRAHNGDNPTRTGPRNGAGGGGAGAGLWGMSWPIGVYVVRDGDVRFVPALDVTRVLLAALAVARVAVAAHRRRSPHHRSA